MKKIVLPLVVLLILGTCCVSEKKEEKGKILMIIAPKDFRDEELSVPEEIFEKNGYRVYIASTEKEATGCWEREFLWIIFLRMWISLSTMPW